VSFKAACRVAEERQRAHQLMLAFERLVLELESALPALEDGLKGVEHRPAHGALEGLRRQLTRLEDLGDG